VPDVVGQIRLFHLRGFEVARLLLSKGGIDPIANAASASPVVE